MLEPWLLCSGLLEPFNNNWPLCSFLKVLCFTFGSMLCPEWTFECRRMLRVIFVYLNLQCSIPGAERLSFFPLNCPSTSAKSYTRRSVSDFLPYSLISNHSLLTSCSFCQYHDALITAALYNKPSNWGLWALRTSFSKLF